MFKVIIYNKYNNPIRFWFTESKENALTKAKRIAKANAKKGIWTLVEDENFEQIEYFDYTPF